jgi:methionyl-tRNA formyltransferase
MIKTIFFGTHDFGAAMLQILIDHQDIDVTLVITQPDRPVGRKKELKASAVKLLAEKNNIEIDQPKSLKKWERDLSGFEVGVVAQYGIIIPQTVLDGPKKGLINTHTSLLPKYRGASPIQTALMNGETETGVTIMQMDAGMDTGPILLQSTLAIDKDDTYLDLDKKLAEISGPALIMGIKGLLDGSILPIDQDDAEATSCSLLKREDGEVNWQQSSAQIYNQYRGLTPWPGIWTSWNDKRLKLLSIKPSEKNVDAGKVLVEDGTLYIGTKDTSVEILELQLEGKSKMDANAFANGFQTFSGSTL